MMSRFRSLTPDGERPKEDDISIDLAKFEAELNASIAKFDGKALPDAPPPPTPGAEEADELPPLDLPDPRDAALASPPATTPAPPPAAPPTLATTTGAGFDLLSELRQAVQEKAVATQSIEQERKSRIARTEKAMRGLYRYLVEFSGHLNKIQPALPQVFRPLPNLELAGLRWTESFIDYRTAGGTETSPLDSVSLRYTLNAGNSIRVEKLSNYAPAYLEELKRVGLRFTTTEKRGSRGLVEQIDFNVERAIVVSLLFKADSDHETVAVQARNLTGLGHTSYVIAVEHLDQGMLDELGKHILGRPSQLFQRLIKT